MRFFFSFTEKPPTDINESNSVRALQQVCVCVFLWFKPPVLHISIYLSVSFLETVMLLLKAEL